MTLDDGYFRLPTRPGLGLDLDDAALTPRPPRPYDRRVALREDGSIGLV